jgi:hypothetical protein
MALDLANRHAAGVEAQNLVVKAVEPRLALGDQLRFEAAGPIAGNRDLDLPVLGQDGLSARPVTAVAAAPPRRIALLVAQVLGQLGPQCPLDQGLLELLEKPVLPGQVSGCV